jgi:hypothetical protein
MNGNPRRLQREREPAGREFGRYRGVGCLAAKHQPRRAKQPRR